MNTLSTSRTLLDTTPTEQSFLTLLNAIEDTAQSMGLYLTETLSQSGITLVFSDAYTNEIGEITVSCVPNFCQCGKSATILHAPADMAWLLWTRPRN